MTDLDALLAAILAHPEEDTPRLAYADCLEENGQPERAEFIRAQVELASIQRIVREHGPSAGPAAKTINDLADRERELLESGGSPWRYWQWAEPIPTLLDAWGIEVRDGTPHPAAWQFRRGFVESLACTAADWLAHGDAIRRAHPVTRVRLTVLTPAEMDEMSLRAHAASPIYDPARHLLGRVCAVLWPGVVFEYPHVTPRQFY